MIGAAFALTLLVTSPVATRPDVVMVGDRDMRPPRVTTVVERRPGRHPFVVRFDDGRRHLHGVVETGDVPPAQERLPICTGAPSTRICIEQ